MGESPPSPEYEIDTKEDGNKLLLLFFLIAEIFVLSSSVNKEHCLS